MNSPELKQLFFFYSCRGFCRGGRSCHRSPSNRRRSQHWARSLPGWSSGAEEKSHFSWQGSWNILTSTSRDRFWSYGVIVCWDWLWRDRHKDTQVCSRWIKICFVCGLNTLRNLPPPLPFFASFIRTSFTYFVLPLCTPSSICPPLQHLSCLTLPPLSCLLQGSRSRDKLIRVDSPLSPEEVLRRLRQAAG